MKLSICKFAYKGNIWALPQENLILLNANKKCAYQPTHLQSDQCLCNSLWKVKSGKFGHQVNSDTHLQTGNPDETAPYEPSHQDFHCLLS